MFIEENRNLESSLRERDKTIQDIKKEMDRFEYLADYFRTALRQQEQSIGVYLVFVLCFRLLRGLICRGRCCTYYSFLRV
jgi:hypothetical protein